MSDVAVIVPCLGRPHRIAPVLASFTATAPASVLFVADPHDTDVVGEILNQGAAFIAPGGNYASKVRAGVLATQEPYIFTAADDLDALPGWFDKALEAMIGDVQAVGVDDLIERERIHATHFLMTRAYAEQPVIDGNPGPFYAGYHHWYCDDEFIATAEHRGVYAYAPEARVLHLHPMAGLAEDDETYQLGREQRKRDRRRFTRRQQLWT